MKKIFLFSLFILSSCSVILYDDSIIIQKKRVSLEFSQTNFSIYHIYFEKIGDKKESKGFTIFKPDNFLVAYLFPGTYNIYLYSIVPKTDTTFCVSKYKILKNIKITEEKNIFVDDNFKDLYPSFSIEKYDEESYLLTIDMKDCYELFSISSMSIKQGTDKTRSIDFSFDKYFLKVFAIIPFYQNGDWFMNISFSIKSKIDFGNLENNNIFLSTTYIPNIFLINI
ncbi:MAG TPA: hypothetical protein PLE45_07315 [Spirochaetota bacterium]|nr:hypothetical protein [Spirochaetota bacterium]HOL57054.1 hypothetical protein [Spirochaetota bacterium]HPP04330.1 hypothetical protein [Spirochaetota bacterium]